MFREEQKSPGRLLARPVYGEENASSDQHSQAVSRRREGKEKGDEVT
jgi:hypothetical protein